MTGEKNRFKSLEKLWKLDDEQLKTPKHDEMVLNLLTKDSLFNQIPLVKDIYDGMELAWLADEAHDKYLLENPKEDSDHEILDVEKRLKMGDPSIEIISEFPLFSGPNNFLIGYWDIVVNFTSWITKKFQELNWNRWEHPDLGHNLRNFVIDTHYPTKLFIEVKPKITSFGATLRQIRTYQSYCDANERNTILYTYDTQFKEAFESQGIIVINPKVEEGEVVS